MTKAETAVQSHTTGETPPKVCLVGTCYHSGLPDPLRAFQAQYLGNDAESRKAFPAAVVTGFRQIYWHVFDRVVDLTVPAHAQIRLNGQDWGVQGVSVFVSDHSAQAMGATFPRYIFVVTELVHPKAEGSTDGVTPFEGVNQQRDEQAVVQAVFQQLAALDGLEWLATLKHANDLPPLLWMQRVTAVAPLRLTRCGLFAFWIFLRLLLWQLDRLLADLDLRSTRPFDESMADVLRIKQLSVNVQRYFLTYSITNNADMQAFAQQMRDRYRLREQFQRVPEVNAQIEAFLALRSQLESSSKSTRLNRIVAITAIGGLPVATASMLLALAADNKFILETTTVFSSSDVLRFLGAMAILTLLLGLFLVEFRPRRWWRRKGH